MTLVSIENEQLCAVVNTLGAELHSLRRKANDQELLWGGTSDVWSGRAPILFPIVGALKHQQVHFNGRQCSLEKHGFVKRKEFECRGSAKSQARFRLIACRETLAVFPWQFELHVEFILDAAELRIEYTVVNTSDDVMPFNIGSHPAFCLDLEKYSHSDYAIEFNRSENLQLFSVNTAGLLERDSRAYPLQQGRIWLRADSFVDDALVFKNINSDRISLLHRDLGNIVQIRTGGAPHLGIWAKPGAAFVCIEPWWGHADFADAGDDLASKAELQLLASRHSFSTQIIIST